MPAEALSFPAAAPVLTSAFGTVAGLAQSSNGSGGHWAELLCDLGCLGEVWAESASAALALSQRIGLAGLRIHRGVGHLHDRDYALRLLLERCHSVHAPLGGCTRSTLIIEDEHRQPLLTLRPLTQSSPPGFALRALLATHGCRGRRVHLATPGGDARTPSFLDLNRHCDGITDALDPTDTAELTGQLRLDPDRLRARGRAVQVDPDLVPCLLEALIDHLLAVRIIAGNHGLVRRADLIPHAACSGNGWLDLFGQGVVLRLDTRALDSAWVVQPAAGAPPRRELRLYDGEGRAIAVVMAVPGITDGQPVGDPPVWRALVNALLD